MKKALTIYIDDDVELKHFCGGFVCWRGESNSVTLLSEKVPDDAVGFYLPFEKQAEGAGTQWVREVTE